MIKTDIKTKLDKIHVFIYSLFYNEIKEADQGTIKTGSQSYYLNKR